MAKGLIVYFSQDGTTARVAESIASGLRTTEWQTDLCNLKDKQPPEADSYDLIGIGSPVYYYRPPFNVIDFIESLPDLSGRSFFVFVVHGTYRGDTGTMIRRILILKGAREIGYFHCRGADYFLGYIKQGYFFSPSSPTVEELSQAEMFGCELAARLAGQPYTKPEEDRPPAIIYRLERFFLNRWLIKHLYSRLFTVSAKKCNACGLCMKLCPTGNITQDKNERPVWDPNCLLCLMCELKCPKDAITSPVSWPLFLPFMIYNVIHASHDPVLDHAKVVHQHGRVKQV